jgi:hypothetical protein
VPRVLPGRREKNCCTKEKLLADGDQWESLIAANIETEARYR